MYSWQWDIKSLVPSVTCSVTYNLWQPLSSTILTGDGIEGILVTCSVTYNHWQPLSGTILLLYWRYLLKWSAAQSELSQNWVEGHSSVRIGLKVTAQSELIHRLSNDCEERSFWIKTRVWNWWVWQGLSPVSCTVGISCVVWTVLCP